MFVSQLPCGDACIYKASEDHEEGRESAWSRTGAKRLKAGPPDTAAQPLVCQASSSSEAVESARSMHVLWSGKEGLPVKSAWEGEQQVGELRTKPGRGEPTLSLSCRQAVALTC